MTPCRPGARPMPSYSPKTNRARVGGSSWVYARSVRIPPVLTFLALLAVWPASAPIGRKTILGLIDVTRKLDVTESCPDPNGGPATTNTRKLGLPPLFDPQESRWRPGRRLRHTVRQKDK